MVWIEAKYIEIEGERTIHQQTHYSDFQELPQDRQGSGDAVPCPQRRSLSLRGTPAGCFFYVQGLRNGIAALALAFKISTRQHFSEESHANGLRPNQNQKC